jgi:hypothetical protein
LTINDHFVKFHNIRVAHYIQKIGLEVHPEDIYKELNIEKLFDIIAILRHDSDKHQWVIDEAKLAFAKYIATGAKKDQKRILFESPKMRISFNAKKKQLVLMRRILRKGEIVFIKKYKAILTFEELV